MGSMNIVGCSSKTSTAMPDSSSMFKHELSFYNGKPLGVLMNEADVKLVRHTYSTEPPGRLSSVYLVFENKVTIRVSFSSFKYVSPLNLNEDWDFELLKKEIVSELEYSK
jgi:hypothetical protein